MPKERNKADDYREKAYAGDTKAMNNLGVCYERGTGVKLSLELAFEWYMKAAELGMQVWHHKAKHKKFKYGLPLILFAQIALIYFINK